MTCSPWPSGSTSLASTSTVALVVWVIRTSSGTAIGGGDWFGVTVTVTVAEACAPTASVTVNGMLIVRPPASIGVETDMVEPSRATPGSLAPTANVRVSPVASSGSLTNGRRLTDPVVPASTSAVPSVAVGGRFAGASTSTVTGADTTWPCWSSARNENPAEPEKPVSGVNVTVNWPPAEMSVLVEPPRIPSQQAKKTMSPSGSWTWLPISIVTGSPAFDVALMGSTVGARLVLTITARTALDVSPSGSVTV